MSKICYGCGIPLQNKDENKLGYTPNLNNDLCKRCFRLKNYGEIKNNDVINNDDLLNTINSLLFFLS